MTRSRADPCLLYQQKDEILFALFIFKVDDNLIAGSDGLKEIKNVVAEKFLSKAMKVLGRETNFVEWGGVLCYGR